MPPPNATLMRAIAQTLAKDKGQPLAQDYVPKATEAIADAVAAWQVQAKFTNIRINSVTAVGPPGCLSGPSIGPFVLAKCPNTTEWERKMSSAVASAAGTAWDAYQGSVAVPGLPWYPTFAAVPAPIAPPTPNIPMPLASLKQMSGSSIALMIQEGIKAKGAKVAHAEVIAEVIGAVLKAAIPMWLTSVMVQNVLGKGPVPTFAPPYVPVGPVVNGDVLPLPGVLV